jgi:cbb3-type cytochrome oxidase subunit 3
MAIENIQKHLILALLIFIIAFWLFVASSKTKAGSNEASRTT